jgi:hypothetical protein
MRPVHLLVARNVLEPETLKFFVVNAPHDMPLTVMLHVAFSRWPVERCFEDQKTELGFDHFEGRSYVGLMRHQTITALTHLFLSRVRQQWGGNPELTVCQIRTAAAAWVQSWWLTSRARTKFLDRTARKIRDTQRRNARSRKSHRKRTLRRLHALGITVSELPRCGWNGS